MRTFNVTLIAMVIALLTNAICLGGSAIILRRTHAVSLGEGQPWHLPAWVVDSADWVQNYKPLVVFGLILLSFVVAKIGYEYNCRNDNLPGQ